MTPKIKNTYSEKNYPAAWTENYFRQDDSSLKAAAAKSTIWLFSQTFAERFIRLFFTAILARLLTPKDFGLMGTAALVLGLVRRFGNFGFGTAIIQKKDVNRVYLSTAFWFNSGLGIFLWLCCMGLSPLASVYFKNDAVKYVVAVMSFSFIFQGFSNVHQSILAKELRFDKIAIFTFFGTIFSRTLILCYALMVQANYWALVIGDLSVSVIAMVSRYYYTRWRPYLVFDKNAFKDMFNFGKSIFLHGILDYFTANVDYLIVGRRLGVDILGIYLFAYTIPHVILSEFSMVLMQVLFPVLSKIKDDKERFKRGYLKCLSFVSLVSFPVCMGMMVSADHFIMVLYGKKWEAAIIPFRILCFSGMAKSILTTMGAIYKSKGRPDIELKWNAAFFPVIVVCVFIGSYYGLIGVAIGMTVTSYLHFITLWRALHLAEIRIKSFISAIKIATVGTGFMVMNVYYFNRLFLSRYDFAHIVSLSILFAVGVTVYGGYLLIFARANLFELVDMVKNGLRKKAELT